MACQIGNLRPPVLLSIRTSVVLGHYESTLLRLLGKLVDKQDVVIDVGANEGYISVPLAIKVGDAGHVFSIEPHPANLSALNENIQMNKLSNVTIISKAASDKKGIMKFSGDMAWGTLLDCPHIKGKAVNVSVDLLDNMVPNNFKSSITLIKIDTEGNEIKVIRGAQALIQLARPVVVFEANLSLLAYVDISISETFNFLEANNYRLFKEKGGKLMLFDWFDERICNLVAIPNELLSKKKIQSIIMS